MKCPNCRTENPEGAKFCVECGQSLQAELVCSNCGGTSPPGSKFCKECGHPLAELAPPKPFPPSPEPTSFVSGRYQVKEFLGEGGKKKVYLTHDTVLDRDVAFALLKTETLDDEAMTRIRREAQAMGRLGSHQNIVTVHDFGEHDGQPYLVIEVMEGGEVEKLIEQAPEHRLSIEEAVGIARSVCQGLEFAHSKGIIHRDLKPSNVWLSADGTIKIGDFGLAFAVDVSRLTQEGMMVGTAFYMPPEQVMGSDVTPRSDLYSLGAMLYEMVTGRPPFVGDTSVAIITQHIDSSPPISPTWHRADLPTGLEALIMQLLEKDPQKRPASAADVLKVLDSIETGKVSELQPEASAIDRGPLYHRVFVGREAELKQLQSAFDGAASGGGALMMVVGEPGIGKTAICEQLSTYVTLHGGKPLWGHCYEEGSLSLPYLAFVEAIRSYVLTRETRDLRKELGTGAADVARIVSEIKAKLKVKLEEPGDPEEERYRLMQAVTGFLTNAARVQPLLIVLEDLHDADRGTMEMLTYVSRNLGGTRILIIGTYRDVEVDRAHPLSSALAELRRFATYDRVLLRGLNADEVQRMWSAIAGQEVSWGLAETVHRQTEGNPLFVQEVIRYLRESGLVTGDYGRWQPASQTPLEMSIPEGLRDVIGKRLSFLSKECNRILSIAAVIGREFRLKVLQRVAGVSEDELFAALREAMAAVVVEERSTVGAAVTYRFTHAFFRQTMYEEMIAPERIRMHQQVARALEEVYAARLEEHAAELADHFSYSSDPADLAKAVSYGEMAAERAQDVFAYGEAVRFLEQTLKVQGILDPEDRSKRCDLLVALGEALILAGEPRRVLDTEAPEALSLAEAIDDTARTSWVCQLAVAALMSLGAGYSGTWATSEAIEWAERADRYADPDTADRARADTALAIVKYAAGFPEETVQLLNRALELARRLGEHDIFWWVAGYWLYYVRAPQHLVEALQLVEELAEQLRAGVSAGFSRVALQFMGDIFMQVGQRQRAEEIWSEYRTQAKRTGVVYMQIGSMVFDAFLATMDGHLAEAMEIVQSIQVRGEEAGIREYARTQALAVQRPRLHLGKADEILQSVPESSPWVVALCLANLGRDTEVAEILEQRVLARPGIGSAEDEVGAGLDVLFLEAAVLVRHREVADLLLKRLAGWGAVTAGGGTTCVARHLGAAAALIDRPEEARTYYQEAIKVCTEMRLRPDMALTRLQLAELLLEHYPDEKSEALEHLDFAINEFREMKMQPSLERALKHKEILGA